MNESKVNNLRKVIKSEMMPDSLVNSSRITLSYEEKINSLNEEINELKYTVISLMYINYHIIYNIFIL